MTRPLEGKTVLLSGASGGIGHATARLLGSVGAQLALSGRTPARLSRSVDQLVAAGLDAEQLLAIPADLGEAEAARAVVDATLARFGALDVLVCAAGSGCFRRFDELSVADIDAVLRSNLLATLWLCHAALPQLRARRGHIILIGSGLGRRGAARATAYCAAKFAVHGFAEALRLDLARHGVRVTLIAPAGAGVATEFWATADPQVSRRGMFPPERVAEAVLMSLAARPGSSLDELTLRGTEP